MRQVPLWRRYDRLAGSDPVADVKDELRFHLESKIDDLVAKGWHPEAARKEAERQFGNIDAVQHVGERIGGYMDRRRRWSDYWDDAVWDFRFTLRALRRDKGFAVIAILILALAIGSNIAVFSVVNTLLLRPLPFQNAQQLVWIAPPPNKCGLSCATYSTDAYDEFRIGSRSYQDVTGYFAFSSADNLKLSLGDGAPIMATSIDVVHNFFPLLGVRVQMGRVFTADDARNGAAPVILLTNPWWKRQFNADPNIVGKAFDMNGVQTTVIGVLPASFDFGAVFAPGTKVDAITPLNLYGPLRNMGSIITMIGRLKPGVTLAQADNDAARVAPSLCLSNTVPQTCGQFKGQVVPVPLKDYVSGKLRRSLVVLWCAVGAILLIACVNLSNLLLARAAARSKEFALRGALGAGRGRIIRQLLTESLVLSLTGAIVGLLLAAMLVSWFAHQGAIALPLLSTLHIDGAALIWTVLIAAFATSVFGLVPGLRMAGGNVYETLKDTGPGATASRRHERTRSILVVSEVALACMLLVGAGLLLRSFLNVLKVDLGFQPDRAAAIQVDYDDNVPNDKDGSLSAAKRGVIFQQILSRVGALPGVEAAGVIDYLPLGQNRFLGLPFPKGVNVPPQGINGPLFYVITPGYMRAMGTSIRGRDFTWSDTAKSEQVVMVNKSFAKYLDTYGVWKDHDALGKVLWGGPNTFEAQIVGIVDDVHEENLDGDAGWQVYAPTTQQPPTGAQLVVRTQMPPSALASSVLATLRGMNPKQGAAEFKPIQLLVTHAVSGRQFFMLLVVAFATLGLLLASLGIYGVISYSVTRKTQEIGIRMALGATAERVRRAVLGDTFRLTAAGIVLGGVASIATARFVAAMLFKTSPWDAATYVLMALALLAVALVSGYMPARRASRIDPIQTLRNN